MALGCPRGIGVGRRGLGGRSPGLEGAILAGLSQCKNY